MEKGHMGFRELIVITLLMLGFAAAVFVLMGTKGGQAGLAASPGTGNTTAPGEPEEQAPDAPPQEPSNATMQPTPVPPETTNKSMGGLLADGLARADSRFYSEAVSGQFKIKTSPWTMGKPNESPDSIPLKQNDLRASGIRFNGRYEDSLRGFAFRTYEVEGLTAPTKIFGVAVFLSNSSVLDPYLQNSSELTIQYDPHPELAQIMEGCSVLSGTDMVTPGGAALRVYDISCKIMYGVYS